MRGNCVLRFWIFFFLFNLVVNGNAQTDQSRITAYSILHAELIAASSNPASISQLKKFSIAIASERKYLLKELNSYLITAGVAHTSGNFAVTAIYSGFADHNESTIAIAYGKKMGKLIDLGVQLNYYRVSFGGGYGSGGSPGAVIGTIWHLHEKVHTGFAIRKSEKPQYEWGIGYESSDQFLFSLIISKETDRPVNINCGIIYSPARQLSFKAGIFTVSSSPWIAATFIKKQIKIEILSAWHPQLGVSPGLILSVQQKSKTNEAP